MSDALTQAPDLRPGPYYVTCVDGNRFWLMSGPYEQHADALADVDRCRTQADAQDPRACFMAWGTARKEGEGRPGRLNELGLIKIPGVA